MDRRAFLTTGATGVAVVTAGRSGVGGTTTLTDPEVETRDDGQKMYLTYHRDDERLVTVGFD